MEEEAAKEFFRHQREDPENQVCVDTGTANPQWASLSHGCYISMQAAGQHRGLGVHISFVRSVDLDKWKPTQLKLMQLGGNRRLRDFFRQHGIPDDMPIEQKYDTRAAEWYRLHLRALAEDTALPEPLPEGTGHLPAAGVAAAAAPMAGETTVVAAGSGIAAGPRAEGLLPQAPKCPAGHELQPWTARAGLCDGCSNRVADGARVLDCRRCNWYLCSACCPEDAVSEATAWGALASMPFYALDAALRSAHELAGDFEAFVDGAAQDVQKVASDVQTLVASSLADGLALPAQEGTTAAEAEAAAAGTSRSFGARDGTALAAEAGPRLSKQSEILKLLPESLAVRLGA